MGLEARRRGENALEDRNGNVDTLSRGKRMHGNFMVKLTNLGG